MNYSSLNKASIRVAKDVKRIAEVYNIDHRALFSVKAMPQLEKYGFIGVVVSLNKIPLANVTVDKFNNQIHDSTQAIQYMSLRINKLIERYLSPDYESI